MRVALNSLGPTPWCCFHDLGMDAPDGSDQVGRSVARILVAEPDPDALALIQHAIAAAGHETVLYRPGSELPDVDVMVFEPGMGQRVVALAKVLATASPPVAVVVVSIQPPELAVHELRPVAYVLKPFSLDELRAAVEKAVRVRGERP